MTRWTLGFAIVAVGLAAGALYHVRSVARELREGHQRLLATNGRLFDAQDALAREIRELRQSALAARERSALPRLSVDRAGEAEEKPRPNPTEGSTATVAGDVVPSGLPGANLLARYRSATGEAKAKWLEDLADLARLGDEEALSEIVGALDSEDPSLREAAVKALGDVGDPALLPYLEASMQDESAGVREQVAKALLRMPPEQAGQLLTRFLDDGNGEVIEESIESLSALGYRKALPQIVHHARTGNLDVAAEAGAAMRSMGYHEGAVMALERVAVGLSSPDLLERINAIKRIAKIGGEEAVVWLERALQDADVQVRERAQKQLKKLQQQ